MKNVNDLIGISEETFTKKEDSKQNANIIESTIPEPKQTERFEVEESEKAKPEKKIKRHFQYRNGKIRYINSFSGDLRDGLALNVRKSDRSAFLRNVAVIIIILSMGFLFLAMKDGFFLQNSASGKGDSLTGDSTKEIVTGEPKSNETMNFEEITESIQGINAKELEKVEKYLDIKSNRVSTIAEINKSKKEKENLYLVLLNSQKRMTEEEFSGVEELIVKSVGMSMEFLIAFESNQWNEAIQEIVNKYSKGGN